MFFCKVFFERNCKQKEGTRDTVFLSIIFLLLIMVTTRTGKTGMYWEKKICVYM